MHKLEMRRWRRSRRRRLPSGVRREVLHESLDAPTNLRRRIEECSSAVISGPWGRHESLLAVCIHERARAAITTGVAASVTHTLSGGGPRSSLSSSSWEGA